MSKLFKIGEFSKIAQVSIHLLRHYDRINLLKPIHVDERSGYRYYNIDQLSQLNRIQALKGMGLSLEQVGHLLEDKITISEIRTMLTEKHEELEERIASEMFQLSSVEYRLQELETEGQLSSYIPVLKQIPQQYFLALQEHATVETDVGSLFWGAYKAVLSAEIDATFSMGVFHSDFFNEDKWDWEYGYLVTEDAPQELAIADGRKLELQILPEVEQMITVIHHGAWTGLNRGYQALGRWLDQHNYQFAGYGQEVYLRLCPPERIDESITEIQFPVAPL